jgi:hypothetical protein
LLFCFGFGRLILLPFGLYFETIAYTLHTYT